MLNYTSFSVVLLIRRSVYSMNYRASYLLPTGFSLSLPVSYSKFTNEEEVPQDYHSTLPVQLQSEHFTFPRAVIVKPELPSDSLYSATGKRITSLSNSINLLKILLIPTQLPHKCKQKHRIL